jgi:flagellar motor component MotA
MRYQASQKSPNETHQMLNSQLEMMQYKLDVDYNMIRYLSWLIPTLGFIGTVVGIANALAYAGIPGKAEEDVFLAELTSRLAVAFDTTLVALIMSAILVYIMHLMQGREENIVQKCGEYCLNNFINRLISK